MHPQAPSGDTVSGDRGAEFELADEGQGGDVTLHVEARRIGRLSGRLGFAPAHSLAFIQWIYP